MSYPSGIQTPSQNTTAMRMNQCSDAANPPKYRNLKLCLILHLLEDRFHFGSLHNITLDLQLSTHKQLLRIRLSLDKLSKIGIT
jgi:hypothetical protein